MIEVYDKLKFILFYLFIFFIGYSEKEQETDKLFETLNNDLHRRAI
jgi:hypothetical protein